MEQLKKIALEKSPAPPNFSLVNIYKKFFNYRDNLLDHLFKLGVFALLVWGAYKIGFFGLFIKFADVMVINNYYVNWAIQEISFLWNDFKYLIYKYLS